MKKWIVMLLAVAMVMALVACGTEEEKPAETAAVVEEPTETVAAVEETPFATIEAKECYYDAGFVELIAGAEEASTYVFAGENSEADQWSVYVLEEAFEEGYRYIKQVAEPVLTGDGEVTVEPGQFVYVYCAANEFTTAAADENAKLNVTVK